MEFNLQKYLVENKLTRNSYLREDDQMLDIDAEIDDTEVDEPEDDWNKPEPDDSAQFEKEPSRKDAETPETYGDELKLQNLIKQKDELVKMYNDGKIKTTDEFKKLIGDIPQTIKALRAKLKPVVSLSNDDDEDAI